MPKENNLEGDQDQGGKRGRSGRSASSSSRTHEGSARLSVIGPTTRAVKKAPASVAGALLLRV